MNPSAEAREVAGALDGVDGLPSSHHRLAPGGADTARQSLGLLGTDGATNLEAAAIVHLRAPALCQLTSSSSLDVSPPYRVASGRSVKGRPAPRDRRTEERVWTSRRSSIASRCCQPAAPAGRWTRRGSGGPVRRGRGGLAGGPAHAGARRRRPARRCFPARGGRVLAQPRRAGPRLPARLPARRASRLRRTAPARTRARLSPDPALSRAASRRSRTERWPTRRARPGRRAARPAPAAGPDPSR